LVEGHNGNETENNKTDDQKDILNLQLKKKCKKSKNCLYRNSKEVKKKVETFFLSFFCFLSTYSGMGGNLDGPVFSSSGRHVRRARSVMQQKLRGKSMVRFKQRIVADSEGAHPAPGAQHQVIHQVTSSLHHVS
jgi:hypothetical protein